MISETQDKNNENSSKDEIEDSNDEIFFEACESIKDLEDIKNPSNNLGSIMSSQKYSTSDFIVRRVKPSIDRKSSLHINQQVIASNFSTKNSEVSVSKRKFSAGKVMQINTEKKLGFNLEKTEQRHPILASMRNSNINSSANINVNFNIKINCDNNNRQTERNNRENSDEKYEESSKIKIDTIYETSRQETEMRFKSSDFFNETTPSKINRQYENLVNFNLQNVDSDKSDFIMVPSSPIVSRKSHNKLISNVPKIKFEMKNEIDINFLRKHLRSINVKYKLSSSQKKHFRNIIELQNFEVDTQQIWIVKISNNGQYIATGGKSGILKIFEILNYDFENYKKSYSTENIFSYLNFINEKPIRIYNDHSNDIIDICWSPKNNQVLLTASLDHLVIMWNLENDFPVCKFNHSSIVTCICFYPNSKEEDDDKFVSGCIDKYIRIWSTSKNKVLDYTNIKEYITAISYFPTGDMIVVGTHNGRCSVYDLNPKLRYNFSFTCKNRMGKYSLGRKITNIEFINRTQALITTNDSRIRLVNISDGKMIQKYKGHINEEYMIRSFSDESNDLIISASEDAFVYVWNKFNKGSNDKKNYCCEFFKPFHKDTSACSIIVNDICSVEYLKKFFNVTAKIMIYSIIINASVGGRLQVLINCEDINS